MALIIDENGIQNESVDINYDRIKTSILNIDNPIVKNFTFASNSIEGNFTNIIALLEYELGESAMSIINNLNPLNAVGIWLDILALFYPSVGGRVGATYTIQPIDIVITQPLTLTTDFAVSDGTNVYNLMEDTSFATSGTYTLLFQASKTGNITSQIGSINIIQTTVLGVSSVINSTGVSQQGQIQENDTSLRNRIILAKNTTSGREVDRIQNSILKVSGVSYAMVYENDTTEIVNGIDPRSIYCVVDGGSDNDVATAISKIKTAGVPTNGTVEVLLNYNGSYQIIYFDRISTIPIYANITVKQTGNSPISTSLLKNYISSNFINSGQDVFSGDIVSLAEDYLSTTGGVEDCEISLDNITFGNIVSSPNVSTKLSLPAENITVILT